MLGFVLVTLSFIGLLFGINKLMDVQEIRNNWPKYRCRPDVMLTASLYGHDANENLEFCLKNGFDERAKALTGPFYTFMAMFTQILMTFLNSINSIRMIFATIVGTVTQVFNEFSERIKMVMTQIQTAAIRIRFLMGRVFASLFAVLFMALSGIKATTNFGNTFLFKFLDTFCFDPETPIETARGVIPIYQVRIGDLLKDGSRVTSTFAFFADGQTMVRLRGTIVSTNHYVLYSDKWIQARDHPDAVPIDDWNGGSERPLICLNTHTHQIPIGDLLFSDYDESEEGDAQAMREVTCALNGGSCFGHSTSSSAMGCGPEVALEKKDGILIPAAHLRIGDQMSFGTVIGLVRKEVYEMCMIQGERFAAGTSIWNKATNKWQRANTLVKPQRLVKPEVFVHLIVSPSATLMSQRGVAFRDYVEIHDPRFEEAYANALRRKEPRVQTEC
jgi:hypothetical protein